MVGVINKPKTFTDRELLIKTATTKGLSDEILDSFKLEKSIEKGETTELKVLTLSKFLDGVKKVFKVETGSELEAFVKVDVVILFDDGSLKGFQVKSSKCGAINHIKKSRIGVIWIGDSNNIDIFKQLMKWLDRSPKQEIINVFKMAKLMRDKTILLKPLNLTELQLQAVRCFNLAVIKEGYIKF